MARSASLVLIALTVSVIILTVTSESLDQDQLDLPLLQKRPFCNAFTGCGRKRSNQRENGDLEFRKQNRLYALLQQKLAEIQAIRGLLDENKDDN